MNGVNNFHRKSSNTAILIFLNLVISETNIFGGLFLSYNVIGNFFNGITHISTYLFWNTFLGIKKCDLEAKRFGDIRFQSFKKVGEAWKK